MPPPDPNFQKLPFQILRRSLERGHLGHAYQFSGDDLAELENAAQFLAKVLNCLAPVTAGEAQRAVASCNQCLACRRIDSLTHPDIHWLRPESKSRVITVEQVRLLMQTIHLKPAEAKFKVAILSDADRLNIHAANAFLKTLEEPPERSLLLLLTTEPSRILETIASRCLRLCFAGENQERSRTHLAWLQSFAKIAATAGARLLERYKLVSNLLAHLSELRGAAEQRLTSQSLLGQYEDLEPHLKEKLERELAASIEAEYRRERNDLVRSLNWWLRDVWLQTLRLPSPDLLQFPELASLSGPIVEAITPSDALENLEVIQHTHELLDSNVQEALVLEVGMLKLKLGK